jgi:hypothetical protein
MTTKIKLGNGDNMGVSLPVIDDYAIIIGTGANDFVKAGGAGATTADISNSTIKFGGGAANLVEVTTLAETSDNATATSAITNDSISFGKGDGDSVEVLSTAGVNTHSELILGLATATASITYDTITFGNGNADFVLAAPDAFVEVVPPGRGEAVANGIISHDIITFGDGNADSVGFGGGADGNFFVRAATTRAITDDTITFGDGSNDSVAAIDLSNNKITFGNGSSDSVYVDFTDQRAQSSNNTITMGNGAGDSVTLAAGAGGDTIVTGTGLDTVMVGTHTNADTFGFALGTNGTSFTKITGALPGDHVVSGNNLGNHVVSEPGTFTSLSDFFSFVTGHHPANGNTYIGYSTTDTFIVTDFLGQDGNAQGQQQLGAVDIVGIFNNIGPAVNHILTLA